MSDSLEDLSRALGVKIVDSPASPGSAYSFGLRVAGFGKPTGFEIEVQQSLLSSKAELKMDSFPFDILNLCSTAFKERKTDLISIIAASQSMGLEVVFEVNGIDIREVNFENEWKSLTLIISKKAESYDGALSCLKLTVLMCLSIMLTLITVQNEDLEEQFDAGDGPFPKEEGARSVILSNKYERSRVNRAICLEIHGFVCAGCNLRMADLYGPIGENVIHVHHLEPVSLMESPRVLDPAKDLVPLCPNCHTIVHRVSPPLSLDILQDALRK